MKTQGKRSGRFISGMAALAVIIALGVVVSIDGCKVKPYGSVKLASINLVAANDLSAAAPVMAGGTTLQLTATGVFSDSTTKDMTSGVTWASSDPAVTISPSGLVTASAVSADTTCTITATDPDGVSGTVILSVRNATLASIDVTSPGGQLDAGTTAQLTATGTFTGPGGTFTQDITSMATWSTSDSGCVTVNNGLATGVSGGTATITASVGTVTSDPATASVSGLVLVSLDINPKSDGVGKGKSNYFTALAAFDDGSTKDVTQSVAWSSSDTSIAMIGSYNTKQAGMAVTGMAPGTVTITATLGSKSASTDFTVSASSGPY